MSNLMGEDHGVKLSCKVKALMCNKSWDTCTLQLRQDLFIKIIIIKCRLIGDEFNQLESWVD